MSDAATQKNEIFNDMKEFFQGICMCDHYNQCIPKFVGNYIFKEGLKLIELKLKNFDTDDILLYLINRLAVTQKKNRQKNKFRGK